MGQNFPQILWFIMALVLAGSALAAQRAPFSYMLKSAIAWAAIILIVMVAVSHRYEMQAMFSRVTQALGIDEQQVSGETVRIRMSDDGHFWARVSINGTQHMMLIDSGATVTAMSEETARSAGIRPGNSVVQLNTANGVVEARRGRIEQIDVGPLQMKDLGVVISPAFGDTDVLGMNFLSRLGSWRVEGKTLILEPGNGGLGRGGSGNDADSGALGAGGTDDGDHPLKPQINLT